eukprot:CAMPEP_0171073154 /NCGR_PEP_ID=MMETSP0766_2-20121228/11327_1 /TAXON_ID=439317 /ORGANISM="Gambierdiscus australes, Strain CAWD 149" /LENGTH=55 /DNA_ID=CAMNT_0011529817 /DNA_START=468 /DNA_END=635 /DNA_ORIENTATION=+
MRPFFVGQPLQLGPAAKVHQTQIHADGLPSNEVATQRTWWVALVLHQRAETPVPP